MTAGSAAAGQRLVLISGPIASGKTTVALRLAALARERGQRAAAIDIDEVVATVAGEDWSLVRPEDRKLASEVAAAMVDRLFESGVALVAIAGSTLSPYEWKYLLERLASTPDVLIVLLHVSLEESIRRAQADQLRVHSTLEDSERISHITRLYAQIDWEKVTNHDLEIDTDRRTVDEVVSLIGENVLAVPS